jgi:hypothetical protein
VLNDCEIPSPWFQDHGGARRDRTDDLKLAKLALSQLSYGPIGNRLTSAEQTMVGPGRFELPTPRLSSVCSNQLSYGPSPAALPKLGSQSLSPSRPIHLWTVAGGREVQGRETETAVKPL